MPAFCACDSGPIIVDLDSWDGTCRRCGRDVDPARWIDGTGPADWIGPDAVAELENASGSSAGEAEAEQGRPAGAGQ